MLLHFQLWICWSIRHKVRNPITAKWFCLIHGVTGYAEGTADKLGGKIDNVIGSVTGDKEKQLKGSAREEKGTDDVPGLNVA
jgi:hypothetical protein